MTDYPAELKRLLNIQTDTIARHTLANGETVWVRKTGKSIPQWRYTLLGLLAKTFRLGALSPVPNLGGSAAIAIEANRLKTLSAHSIPAPRLLAELSDGLMFTHLGEHNLLHFLENDTDQLGYWQRGLEAIHAVHRQNQYLSQAFARNIIVQDNGGIGFIDFEDDPGLHLNLTQCQSRDYLCYFQSTCNWLKKRGNLAEAAIIWQQHRQTLPAETLRQIETTVRPMLWMRRLKARRWGNDTLRLAALAELFTLAKAPSRC